MSQWMRRPGRQRAGLGELDDAMLDYIERVLANGVAKEWVLGYMRELEKGQRAAVRADGFQHTYGSPYRPLPTRAELGVGALVVHIRGGTRSYVFTKVPLALDVLYRYELVPASAQEAAQVALDYFKAVGRPVELAFYTGDTRVAHLFKNPRRKWQMSYFDAKGPVSHEEGEPLELVRGAYSIGYRKPSDGLLDAMALDFDPQLLKQMSANR